MTYYYQNDSLFKIYIGQHNNSEIVMPFSGLLTDNKWVSFMCRLRNIYCEMHYTQEYAEKNPIKTRILNIGLILVFFANLISQPNSVQKLPPHFDIVGAWLSFLLPYLPVLFRVPYYFMQTMTWLGLWPW